MTNYFDNVENCFEVFQTSSEDYSISGGSASVQLKCLWSRRYEVVTHVLSGGGLNRPVEYPFELASSGNKLKATGVKIDPLPTKYNGDGQAIQYHFALVTIQYSLVYTEISQDSTLQFVTMNPNGLFWNVQQDGGNYLNVSQDEAPGFRLPSFDLVLSNPYMSLSCGDGVKITDYDGTCNKSAITIRHYGYERRFPAETLLASSPSLKTCPNMLNLSFHAVTMRFNYNPIGHNEWYHPLASGEGLDKRARIFEGSDCAPENRITPIPTKEFKELFNAFELQYVETAADNTPVA